VMPSVRVAGVMDSKGHRLDGTDPGGEAAPAILCLDVDAEQAQRLAITENEGRIKVIIVNETMQ